MADVKADPSLPLFDDVSIQPYGVKLMGGHLFPRELGDPGSGLGTGYVSPGHTSWYQDPETGRMFMVFHARFPGTGELHEVRVHQMWINQDGWPVVSPMRYAGETAGKIKRGDVVGTWQLIDMGHDITATAAKSIDVTLTQQGRVTGGRTGTWERSGQNTATLTIDGEVYSGVFAPIWDPDLEEWSLGLTAVSDEGVTLWGRQSIELTDAAAVEAVVADLDLGDTSAVTIDLDLPVSGTGGTTITWTSSDDAVITADGTVTRPSVGEADATATLTATVANGAASTQVPFEITVLARTPGRGRSRTTSPTRKARSCRPPRPATAWMPPPLRR